MRIDLHIHSRDGSDGRWSLEEIFAAAAQKGISILSITDHDAIHAQGRACDLARLYGIRYITGVELNVTFSHPDYTHGKATSLDFLGYQYDIHNPALIEKLQTIREYRQRRAEKIVENLNREFVKEGLPEFTASDLDAIQATVDGAIGRPHIADYLIRKGIVATKQEAFDRYLIRFDVPKMPLSLAEASDLIRGAGGILMLAHPNDPHGTSLAGVNRSLEVQHAIIQDAMMGYIDGIECWHSRHDRETAEGYQSFARERGLVVSGGSDCHQQPVLMGEVEIPEYVGQQFGADEPRR